MDSISTFLDKSLTIDQVDQKIQILRDSIRSLQQYRNARLVSVSKLPQEILSMIFECMALSRYQESHYSAKPRPYLGWMPVSQVCQLWRHVAFNTPRMWSCIYDHIPEEFAEFLLERAGSAPLYLRGCNRSPRNAIANLLCQHSSRLKGIDFDLESYTAERLELLTILQRAPMLDSLAFWYPAQFVGYRVPPTVKFAPHVESGVVPPLRHLLLERCILKLNVPFFSHLQTLEITGTPSRRLTILDVVLSLGSMNHLESLKLYTIVGGSEEIPDDIFAHLPRLNVIEVVAPDLRGLTIFLHISCPFVQRIVAAARIDTMDRPVLEPIASAIYGMAPASASASNIQARLIPLVTMTSQFDLDIRFDPTSQPSFQVSVAGPDMDPAHIALCLYLPSHTPFILAPHQLRITTHMPESPRWDDFILHLEHVEEIHAYNVEDIENIAILDKKSIFDTKSIFRLSTIVLVDLDEREVSEVVDLLASLKSNGVAIETLRVARGFAGLTKSDVENLKQYVGVVAFGPTIDCMNPWLAEFDAMIFRA